MGGVLDFGVYPIENNGMQVNDVQIQMPPGSTNQPSVDWERVASVYGSILSGPGEVELLFCWP